MSKLFTSIVAVQQMEQGRIALDAPVVTYIPEFAANGKTGITVRHLLTHTSGLPAWLPLHLNYPTPEERLAAANGRLLFEDSRPSDRDDFVADGWTRSPT